MNRTFCKIWSLQGHLDRIIPRLCKKYDVQNIDFKSHILQRKGQNFYFHEQECDQEKKKYKFLVSTWKKRGCGQLKDCPCLLIFSSKISLKNIIKSVEKIFFFSKKNIRRKKNPWHCFEKTREISLLKSQNENVLILRSIKRSAIFAVKCTVSWKKMLVADFFAPFQAYFRDFFRIFFDPSLD